MERPWTFTATSATDGTSCDITSSPWAHGEDSVVRFAGAHGWIERLASLALDPSLGRAPEADPFPLSGLDQAGLSSLLERLAQ